MSIEAREPSDTLLCKLMTIYGMLHNGLSAAPSA